MVVTTLLYAFTDIISFDKIDLIYLKNNDEQSSIRIKALIKHNIMNMCYESGDSLIYKEELFLILPLIASI